MSDVMDAHGRPGGQVSRRRLLRTAGGAAAVALAGCKSPARNAGASGGTPTPGGSSTSEDVPDDLFAGETIKLGLLAPLPEQHVIGKSMYYSAKQAAKVINGNGGILGADVEILPANTKIQPSVTRREYTRLTRAEDVDCTFGTFRGQCLMAIMGPMARTETLHMTTAAAIEKPAEMVADEYGKYKYHFRPGPLNASALAEAQLELLELRGDELGWDTAALLVENRADFDPYYATLERRAGEYLDLPYAKRTAATLSNWTPVYDEIESVGVDVALVAQATSGTPAVKQWANQQRNFEYGGIHVWSQFTNYFESTNGSCEYVFTMNSVTPQTKNTPRTQPFMDEFYRAYGFYPIYAGPITYDAVRLYADAVRTLGSKDEADLIPYLEERVWRESTVIGKQAFTGPDAAQPHEPEWTSMKQTGVPVWQQWQTTTKDVGVEGPGVMESFAPEQHETAAYQKPPWVE